jgi:DNA modification methylase
MAISEQQITDKYALYLGDCLEVLPAFADALFDLSIYSPPFGGLYQYSSSERDLSNCISRAEFFAHYDFVIREVARLTKPGRMSAVHCADIPTGNSGLDHLIDLPGEIIVAHCRCRSAKCAADETARRNGECGHGLFEFCARHLIWKEPLLVRNRTMTKSLSHKNLTLDSTKSSIANADQLLIFRRKGRNAVPVAHPTGLLEYAGFNPVPAELLRYRGYKGNQVENRYSHWIWRQYADAFWLDIRIDRVLPHREARDEEDERHVHPLQLDVIDRCLVLYSNPGETVLTPFMGVGSEVYGALCAGRRAVGIELKRGYYRQALRNIPEALKEQAERQATLEFDDGSLSATFDETEMGDE